MVTRLVEMSSNFIKSVREDSVTILELHSSIANLYCSYINNCSWNEKIGVDTILS